MVPKSPDWELKSAVRADLDRIDFDAVYVGEHESGYWMVRFWRTGQIKIFVTDEYSEWHKMETRNYGGIGYFALNDAGKIELEYFSVVAQGVYVTAIGQLEEDGSIAISGLKQRGRKFSEYSFVLIPELQASENKTDWNWNPDW